MSKRKGILLIGAVFVLAAAGVVYAHWTETLTVNAEVSTGHMTLVATGGNTNDDGVNNGWDGPTDNGSGTDYDRWGSTSSNDPSSFAYPATPRYTKDVARCRVTGTVGTTTSVLVENAYPSYHCVIRQFFTNSGTIPAKNQAIHVYACGPGGDCSNYPTNFVEVPFVKATRTFSYDSSDGNSDFELEMKENPNGVCGYQFDPGKSYASEVMFHVLQDAAQNGTYEIRFVLETVNWNEYSLANCVGFSNQPNP